MSTSLDTTLSANSLGSAKLVTEADVPVRDVRLAVTMVGGVALAIYECGVAIELFHMARGQGMYALLKRLTQSHAYVDILSGTSAGGINNVCLAAALANGTEMVSSLRNTWTLDADIDALLHLPESREATTLLQGNRYYYDTLKRQFEQLVPDRMLEGQGGSGPLPSGLPDETDIDLYVTGTFYEGQPRAFFDERGNPIFTEDYNGVFHLQHRPTRGESHFRPGMKEPENFAGRRYQRKQATASPAMSRTRRDLLVTRLTRIARTTSSLPAVFEPSEVCGDDMLGVITLPRSRTMSYMFDGGFLNNRPLDLALEGVYRRTSSREVMRKVVFVEPVAVPLRALPGENVPAPNSLQALMFYRDVPARQSLSRAFTELQGKNNRIRQMAEAFGTARLKTLTAREGGGVELLAPRPDQQLLWAELCLQSLRDELRHVWQEQEGLEVVGQLALIEQQTEAKVIEEQEKCRLRQKALLRMTDALYDVLCRQCRDTPSVITSGEPTWELMDIDTWLLTRQIERARIEIREFRFPRDLVTGADQEKRQDVVENVGAGHTTDERDKALLAVQECVKDLNHVRNLCEILQGNVLLVVATIMETPEYRKAMEAYAGDVPTPQAAQCIADLSALLYTTLAALFTTWPEPSTAAGTTPAPALLPVPDLPLYPRGDPGQVITADAARERRRIEATALAEAMTARSLMLCSLLKKGSAAEPLALPAIEAWYKERLPASATGVPVPLPLNRRLEQRLYRVVAAAAEALAPELQIRAQRLRNHLAQTGVTPSAAADLSEQQYFVWADRLGRMVGEAKPDIEAAAFAAGENLNRLDVYLYPLEKAANLPGLTPIDLVYISPRCERQGYANKEPGDKIAGDALMHLGGFLKRSWRANDILWGRLDASCALLDTLLEPARLERLRRASPDFGKRLLLAVETYLAFGDAVLPISLATGQHPTPPEPLPADQAYGIGDLLKQHYGFGGVAGGPVSDWEVVAKWAQLPSGQTVRPADLTNAMATLKEAILWRQHLDILREELPAALGSALAEYAEQRARGMTPAQTPELLPLQAATATDTIPRESAGLANFSQRVQAAAQRLTERFTAPPDDAAVRRAIAQAARREGEALIEGGGASGVSPAKNLHNFFKYRYAIGAETPLRDIPYLVNFQRISQMLLLLLQILTSITASAGGNGFTKNIDRFLLAPLKAVAWVVYSFFTAMKQGRQVWAILQAVLLSALVLLPLGILFKLINTDTSKVGGTTWGVWVVWGLTLAVAAAVAVGRHNRWAAVTWMLGAAGFLCVALGLRSPAEAAWKLPLGEALLLVSLLTGACAARRGEDQKRFGRVLLALLALSVIGALALYSSPLIDWVLHLSGGQNVRDGLPGAVDLLRTLLDPTKDRMVNLGGVSPLDLWSARWFWAGLGAIATLLIGGMLMRLQSGMRTRRTPGGMLDFEFVENGDEAARMINAWTEPARLAAPKNLENAAASSELSRQAANQVLSPFFLALTLDCLFALGYVFTLALLCAQTPLVAYETRLAVPTITSLAALAMIGALVAGLFDIGENAALAAILHRARNAWNAVGQVQGEAIGDTLPRMARFLARIKWGIVAVIALFLLIVGLARFNASVMAMPQAPSAHRPES